MKIKCKYCDTLFDDTLEKCPGSLTLAGHS